MTRLACFLFALFLLACGGGDTPEQTAQAPAPAPAPATAPAPPPAPPAPAAPAPPAALPPGVPPPGVPMPVAVPVSEEQLAAALATVPDGNLRGDGTKGSQTYAMYCATCHGTGGKGDGPTGLTLTPRPADHTDPERMGGMDDKRMYLVIQKGGASVGLSPLMAPWGAILKDQDIRDVVGFVRSLSGT